MRKLLASLGFVALATPALAQTQLSAETDRVFWCASAFFWLAGDASDLGDAADAELYDRWAGELTELGIGMLKSHKISDPDQIASIIDGYDNSVLDELGTDKARYPIEGCQDLVKS